MGYSIGHNNDEKMSICFYNIIWKGNISSGRFVYYEITIMESWECKGRTGWVGSESREGMRSVSGLYISLGNVVILSPPPREPVTDFKSTLYL